MSTWTDKLNGWFSAVAFAEAGEHDTALEMVGRKPAYAEDRVGVLETLSSMFAAAAFAEANCPDVAEEMLNPGREKKSFVETIGLKGVRVWYGFAPAQEPSFFETVGLQGACMRIGVCRL